MVTDIMDVLLADLSVGRRFDGDELIRDRGHNTMVTARRTDPDSKEISITNYDLVEPQGDRVCAHPNGYATLNPGEVGYDRTFKELQGAKLW